MQGNDYVLISTRVLPPVFAGVLSAKRLLAEGKAANVTQAIKMAGISRGAFYKYRDHVFAYTADDGSCIRLNVVLSDKAGVFSAMTSVLYENGANLVTVNQEKPVDGSAAADLTIETEHLRLTPEQLLEQLRQTDGVVSVRIV